MRFGKRLMAFILIFVLSVSCVGCGTSMAKTAKSLHINDEVTINVWYDDDSYTTYLNEVAERFHKANELVTINPVLVDSGDYLESIYDGSVQGDNIADVYLLQSDYEEKAWMLGLMEQNDIYSSYYSTDLYGDAAIDAASHNGQLYGYPLSFNTSFLVYNTQYVSSVDTIAQLKNYSDSYTVSEDNQDVQLVASWDVSDWMLNLPFASSSITVSEDGDEGSSLVQINKTSLTQAMQEYAALKESFGISSDEVDKSYCIDKFKQGQLLYTILDANSLSELNDSDVSYGICAVPALTDNDTSESVSESTMMVVNPFTQNADVAKAVAHAISYDYASLLQTDSGHLSARSDITVKKRESAYTAVHEIYADSTGIARIMGSQEIYLRYEIMIHNIWNGASPQTEVDTFEKAVSQITK